MKIQTPAGPLARMFKILARATSRASTIPSLSALLINAQDGVLTMRATNSDISAVLRAGAPAIEDGRTLVDAHPAATILASMPPDATATLSTTENEAKLEIGEASYKLRVHAANDHPTPPPFDETNSFSLPLLALKKALSQVTPAASADATRPVLTGVKARFDSKTLTLAATDAYRLALHSSEVSGGPANETESLIPAKTFAEALNILALVNDEADESTVVDISLTDSHATMRCGPAEVACRLLAGTFPDYKRLMPDAFEHSTRIESQTLLSSLSRVALFSRGHEATAPVVLAFSTEQNLAGGELTVSVSSSEIGTAIERIPLAVESPITLALNARYLSEAIRACAATGAKEVDLKFNGPQKPIIVSPASDDPKGAQPSCLVMPMRLPDAEEAPAPAPAPAQDSGPAETPAATPAATPRPAQAAQSASQAPAASVEAENSGKPEQDPVGSMEQADENLAPV